MYSWFGNRIAQNSRMRVTAEDTWGSASEVFRLKQPRRNGRDPACDGVPRRTLYPLLVGQRGGHARPLPRLSVRVCERIVLLAGVEAAVLAHERGRAAPDAPSIGRAHVLVAIPTEAHGVRLLIDGTVLLACGGVAVDVDHRHVADELASGRSGEQCGEPLEGVRRPKAV